MTEYGTIKIPREKYEHHNERRQELGLTWSEYIEQESVETNSVDTEEIRKTVEDAVSKTDVDLGSVRNDIRNDVEDVVRKSVEEAVSDVDFDVDVGGVDESKIVKNTVSDIKAELPSLVAEEVRR